MELKKVKIHKGWHRPISIIPACFRFLTCKKAFTIDRFVSFTDSCRYILKGSDQYDWNKLFGVCFGWNGIHKNSARFVWRYNPGTDMIEIAAYYYIDGQCTWRKLKSVNIDEPCRYTVERSGDFIYLDVDGFLDYEWFDKLGNMTAFGCGPYFGGNNKAPKTITIRQSNLKSN